MSDSMLTAPIETHQRVWGTLNGFSAQNISAQAMEPGLRIAAVDLAHVMLIETVVKKDAYAEYVPGERFSPCDEQEMISALAGAKKACGSGALVSLSFCREGLEVKAKGFRRTVALSEPEVEPKIPNYAPSVVCKTDAVEIRRRAQSLFAMFGTEDSTYFNGVLLKASGGMLKVSVSTQAGADAQVDLCECEGEAETYLSADLLKTAFGCLPDGQLEVAFESNKPVRFVSVTEDRLIKTTLLLAPRMEN